MHTETNAATAPHETLNWELPQTPEARNAVFLFKIFSQLSFVAISLFNGGFGVRFLLGGKASGNVRIISPHPAQHNAGCHV